MKLLAKKDNLRPLLQWASIVIIIGGMKASAEILNPFFLAIFISIIASQPAAWLVKKGIPKYLSISIVMLLLFGGVILIGGLIGSSIGQLTKNLPTLDQHFKSSIIEFINSLEEFGIKVSSQKVLNLVDPGKIMGYLASSLNSMGSMLGQIVIIVLIALFMLFELDNFPTKYKIISHGNEKNKNYKFSLIIHNVRSYLGIKTLTSFATGLIIALGLKLIGVQYAFFLGPYGIFYELHSQYWVTFSCNSNIIVCLS